jgi:hypothetical protein
MMAATVTLGDQREEAGALATGELEVMVLGPFAMEKQGLGWGQCLKMMQSNKNSH